MTPTPRIFNNEYIKQVYDHVLDLSDRIVSLGRCVHLLQDFRRQSLRNLQDLHTGACNLSDSYETRDQTQELYCNEMLCQEKIELYGMQSRDHLTVANHTNLEPQPQPWSECVPKCCSKQCKLYKASSWQLKQLVIDAEWRTTNGWCLIANDWCLIANDWCLIANDWCLIANDWCLIAND